MTGRRGSLLIAAIVFAVVGGTIFAVSVPVNGPVQRRVGTVAAVTDSPTIKSGSPTRILFVRTDSGDTFVVALPDTMSCDVGQSAEIYRQPVFLGTRTGLTFKGCFGAPARSSVAP